jgi:site-specific DNA-methyltransferase (adenine-specific)
MTRYPTEKSEGLAERLISWLTRPGDIVVDPFAGSGTVPAVAVRMGRRIVSGDRSSVAAKISSSRIAAAAESMGCVVSMTNTIAPDSPNER